jgi:acetyl esterase/lipase
LGADPSAGFIVGGTSAGGNIAAVLELLARDEKLSPPLTGAALLIPAVTHHRTPPAKYASELRSWEQNADAPVLPLDMIDKFMDSYKPEAKSKLFDVLGAYEDFKGLPPTFFQVCGLDPLRDEAMIFERVLREEDGVKTRMDLYPGLPHSFWSVWATSDKSKQFIEDTLSGVEWILNQK